MKLLIINLFYLALVLIAYQFIPETAQYHKDGITILIPLGLAVILFPIVLALLIKLTGQLKIKAAAIFFFLMITGLSGYIIADYVRLYQIEKEFKQSAVKTYGIVTDKWHFHSTKGYSGWQLKCVFKSLQTGKPFETFTQNDREDKYRIGDTLKVIYLERNPNISRVLDLHDE